MKNGRLLKANRVETLLYAYGVRNETAGSFAFGHSMYPINVRYINVINNTSVRIHIRKTKKDIGNLHVTMVLDTNN